jgi:hypothetical protein
MKNIFSFVRVVLTIVFCIAFAMPSASVFATHKPNHTGGGGPGNGGGPGGGGKNKISISKTLLSEGGVVTGIAEPTESLTYLLIVSNGGKKASTVNITETVPT